MKTINYLSLVAVGLLLIYASLGLPYRGDSDALVNQDTSLIGTPVASSYYIQNAYKDANTPNIVTAILCDYRGFDTLGEEVVIFTAGIVCFLLLNRERKIEKKQR
ncbi:MAG: hydrogen gas-evolving membrane-bound hydrogenase subunit E [Bacteroidota bacterium]